MLRINCHYAARSKAIGPWLRLFGKSWKATMPMFTVLEAVREGAWTSGELFELRNFYKYDQRINSTWLPPDTQCRYSLPARLYERFPLDTSARRVDKPRYDGPMPPHASSLPSKPVPLPQAPSPESSSPRSGTL